VTNASTLTGGVTIGSGGTAILNHYSSAFAINFGSIAFGPSYCADSAAQPMTANLGDTVAVSVNIAQPANVQLTGFVSAANQVKVRWCNFTGAAIDPDGAGATYRVDVWHH
jgi:hypothetical protein